MAIDLKAFTERLSDAYSSDRYKSWMSVARLLLAHGYTEQQTEAIMRSKWARWAADQSAGDYRYGQFPAKVLLDYAKKQGMDEVVKLTEETFQ